MGVFKSMRDLQKQARDIERNMPPAGERMAAAQARMAQASQMLAAQTQAASKAASAAEGSADSVVRRTVTITGMRQVGMINFDLLIEFDLTVLADDLAPYPATTQQTVSQMQIGRLRPGMALQASVDPANPAAIWLDLASLG
jgi:hypothetical protein